MRVLIIWVIGFFAIQGFSQSFTLKWDKQKVQITLPAESPTIAEDTINENDYFEFIDDEVGYDFAFEMIQKGDPGFDYKKNLYKFALKEIKKEKDPETANWRLGKLDGLNSFYALSEDEDIDGKTGAKYKYIVGELVFYSKDKKKLFYFDIEYDEVTISQVEKMIKSIKFYE